MGREKIARVRSILDEGAGDRVEDIAAKIREETQATPARAQLIARDQVLKLNNGVTQARHVAAGVTEYVWRTSRDERVRSRHKELEGTTQAYTEPPVVDRRTGRRAHPGGDYQCRCTAEPIIPRFE
jgi:SPP1 gp7 family putative phage head morphogenesis protein